MIYKNFVQQKIRQNFTKLDFIEKKKITFFYYVYDKLFYYVESILFILSFWYYRSFKWQWVHRKE